MDFGNLGAVYHDTYVNVKTGHRKEVKADIVSWTSTLAAYQELEAVLSILPTPTRLIVLGMQRNA